MYLYHIKIKWILKHDKTFGEKKIAGGITILLFKNKNKLTFNLKLFLKSLWRDYCLAGGFFQGYGTHSDQCLLQLMIKNISKAIFFFVVFFLGGALSLEVLELTFDFHICRSSFRWFQWLGVFLLLVSQCPMQQTWS